MKRADFMKHGNFEDLEPEVREWINQIRNVSEALFLHMVDFVDKGVQCESDYIRIYPRPWVGEKNFLFTFFKEIKSPEVDKVTCAIPENYIDLLLSMNGAHIYSMELFGIASRIGQANLIDHSKFQARDICYSNERLKRQYGLSDDYTYFAVRPYSFTENVGYFFDSAGNISARLKNGSVVGKWSTLEQFFQEELEKSKSYEKEQNRLHSH
ncbi:hypothetical protein BTA51_24265 [Hahella sp. CCB-MM4]|uniref:hypothetical protein n=1 Tax=Hahella sp. (strain CCB-MM4) TaxID=1926491 RepID=UPI000B9B9031|nr:hypothetical protein [Hahella sp. CCB-MM4]OZG70709.1 hypothetical protein BTA51_24265 [Hahella sp. CCB-MM4]